MFFFVRNKGCLFPLFANVLKSHTKKLLQPSNKGLELEFASTVYTNITRQITTLLLTTQLPADLPAGLTGVPKLAALLLLHRLNTGCEAHNTDHYACYSESTLGGNFALDIDYFTTTSSLADYRVRSTLIWPERQRKRPVVPSPLRTFHFLKTVQR